MNLLLRQGVRHHVRHPLRTLLTLLGIAAGVAMACAMQLSQSTAENAFDLALTTIAGRATHTATAGPDGIAVAAFRDVWRELGGRGAAPSVRAIVRVPRGEGRIVLRALGVDPLADADLRPWAGAASTADLPVAALMTVPGGFVATAPVLERLGVKVGDELPLTVAGRPFTGRCVGVLQPPPGVAKGLDDALLVDIATAQEWTSRLDRIDRIDLRLVPESLPDGVSPEQALASVTARLGPGVQIESAGARRGGLAVLARGFRINLRALSLLSLLVGAFLVHETMRLSVVARRRSFGVLRALGARGRALGIAVGFEAALLGLVGSALGVAGSVVLAHVLLDPVVRALNDHYATFELHGVELDPVVLIAGLLLGTTVAFLAGAGPAVAAARVPPREVLVTSRGPIVSRFHRMAVWSIVPAVLAFVLLRTTGDRLVQAYVGTLAMMIAAVLLVPSALGVLLGVLQRAVRGTGPFVRYVVRSTAAARDHLALPVAAMVLALAATIGLATLVASFRDSVATWLVQVLPADVFVMVPGGIDERPRSTIGDEVVTALRTAPGVAASSTYQRTVVRVSVPAGEQDVELVGIEPTDAVKRSFPFIAGDEVAGRDAMVRGDGVWVSEPLAFRLALRVGEPLAIATAAGIATIPICAIYRDYANERGQIMVGKKWFDAHLRGGFTALSMHAQPGTDVDALVADLRARAAAASSQDVTIRSQRDLRDGSLAIFDRTFAITSVMRLLCLAVAFFGIYAAFAALQLERGGEVGLLRCLGARPRQIGLVVLGQTALLGLCAGLLAMPVGALLGHVLGEVVNTVSFGWTLLSVSVPWWGMVDTLVLAVVAAVLAGVQPAWRFANMRPADALREA